MIKETTFRMRKHEDEIKGKEEGHIQLTRLIVKQKYTKMEKKIMEVEIKARDRGIDRGIEG